MIDLRPRSEDVRMTYGNENEYTCTLAGLEGVSGATGGGWTVAGGMHGTRHASPTHNPLFPDFPATGQMEAMPTDIISVNRAEPLSTAGRPQGPRAKKSRYNERQQALRGLQMREFARDHYLTARGLSVSTVGLTNDLLGHLARCRGQTFVRELTDELLYQLRDYFLTQIADGEMGPANANKHLRQCKAIGNQAFKERLVKSRLSFNAFLPEKKPDPKALSTEEYWRIGQAARAVNGFVGTVPASIWWLAWYLTMSRIGNRLTAMMLADRDDYQHGVLHLKAENQKQDEDQRLAIPDYAEAAIEDLLAAHDDAKLFPWPYDQPKPGQRSTWKTLFTHFRQKILQPAGIELKPGVLTRVFRQTVATRIDALGGDATRQLGHSNPRITDRFYKDKRQAPVTKGALLIPEDRPPAPPPGKQLALFRVEAS